MQPQVEFERNVLRVNDVAIVHGDKRDAEALGAMMLPLKGRVGDSIQYKRTDIEKYILQNDHGLKSSVRFLGAERVILMRRGRLLSPETYTAAAKTAIDQKLSLWTHATTELDGKYPALTVPVGDLAIQAKVDAGNVQREMKVWMAIEVDGQSYTTIPVTFKVTWPRSVYVLTRFGNTKSSITEDMLTRAEINVAGISGEVITELEQIKEQRLRHKMEAGAVLRREDLEEKPLIVSGAEVDVMAQVGSIAVHTKAIAQNDGFIGQVINVRVAKTKEKLSVEVIGEGRAIVSANQIHQ